MRLLFLASTFPRYDGDHQAPFVLEQASAWKKARPDDDVSILVPHDPKAKQRETKNGLSVHRFVYMWPHRLQRLAYPAIVPNIRRNPLLFALVPFFLLMEFRAALHLVKRNRIDLIYAHWVMPQGLVAYCVSKLTGTEFVLQNHSSDLVVFKYLPLVGSPLARTLIRSANRLFCVNREQAEIALSYFADAERNEVAAKTVVLPMGVYLEPANFNTETLKGTMHWRYDYGLISRLSKKKGVDLFIAALGKLASHGKRFRAGIAGDGEDRESLQAAASGTGIEFLGFLTGKEKGAFFAETKFMIFPSVPAKGDAEGLPVALLEAMYAGKVVVASEATNIQMLPEWEGIVSSVCLLENPADIDEFAAVLERLAKWTDEAIESTTAVTSRLIARYQWDNLILEYIAHIEGSDEVAGTSSYQESS
ncbi:MAG: glycosyltransferase [Gammaproteobacteria bacterium]|nr:glycosyltransferase [Gammaproteobacteria bacterium]